MITNYTLNEIEHTLYLYPIAKIKVKEIELGNQKTINGSIKLHHYLLLAYRSIGYQLVKMMKLK